MESQVIFLPIIFFLLLFLGVPIGISLGLGSILYWIFFTGFDPAFIGHALFTFIDKYTFMSIIFFILAGILMERSGLLRALFDFAESILCWLPGGLGVSAMVTCMLFGAISGSSVAMAAAMSVMALPILIEKGYGIRLPAGIIASGGSLGLLIPPSLTLIIYGVLSETSISRLFFAGIIPGICLGCLLIIVILVIAIKQGFRPERPKSKIILSNFVKAIWGLLMPILVLGGLYGGLFSPTEAGAAAAAYALIYALVTGIRSEGLEFLRVFHGSLHETLRVSAVIFFLISGAGVFCKVAAVERIPQMFTQAIVDYGMGPIGFLIFMNLFWLVLGCFLDGAGILVLTIPIAFPVALALGIDPIHFGILSTINIEVATITPPVGFNLFAISSIGKIPIGEVLRGSLPFMLMIIAFLFLMIFTPQIATWLPNRLFKIS